MGKYGIDAKKKVYKGDRGSIGGEFCMRHGSKKQS